MLQRNRIFHIYPSGSPSGTCHFIGIPVVAIFEDIINTYPPVTIIIIIRLPHIAKGVYGNFIIITEIIGKHLKITSIGVTAENHALAIGLTASIDDIAFYIFDHVPVVILNTISRVSKVKV